MGILEGKSKMELKLRNSEIPAGVISFASANTEHIRFKRDGKVYVRGTLVDSDQEVYKAILCWLREQKCPECSKSYLKSYTRK